MAGYLLRIYAIPVAGAGGQSAQRDFMYGGNVFETVAAGEVFGPFLLVEVRTVVRRKFHPSDRVLVGCPYDGYARIMQGLKLSCVGNVDLERSDESRVGKECVSRCRYRGSLYP